MADVIDAPEVEAVNMQVRTGLSVPFAPHMRGADSSAPDIAPVDFQVRTGLSVPFASHMANQNAAGPSADPVNMHVRTGLSAPFSPYMLGAHAEELLRKRVVISPVVVVWRYRIADGESFLGWLATREILLSEGRMAGDTALQGIRYGGTYRLADDGDAAVSTYKTIWGFTSEAALHSMRRLCSEHSATATLVQLELIDFVKGLRKFISLGGESNFAQEVMISAAAGQA